MSERGSHRLSSRAAQLMALAVVALVHLAVPAALIFGRERTLAEGTAWRFRTAPVDPADAFRGRYLALGLAADSAPVPPGVALEPGDRVYVPLLRDGDGFAVFGPVATRPPAAGDYLRARSQWTREEEGQRLAQLELPFDRLYLEEEIAPQAEEAYRAAVGPGGEGARPAWAVVKVRGGQAVLEDVVVDGRPIRELLGLAPPG